MDESRRIRSHLISIERIEAVLDVLDKLPDKPQQELSKQEKLLAMRKKIKLCLSRGYSYEEISLVLRQQGIDVTSHWLLKWNESEEVESHS